MQLGIFLSRVIRISVISIFWKGREWIQLKALGKAGLVPEGVKSAV